MIKSKLIALSAGGCVRSIPLGTSGCFFSLFLDYRKLQVVRRREWLGRRG